MASHSLYEKYKQDTASFVQWMFNISKIIVLSQPNDPESLTIKDATLCPAVNNFIPLARFIVNKSQEVPHHIFSALSSAIEKRIAAATSYTAPEGSKAADALEASNAGHQHFTNTLQTCFDILGGPGWKASKHRSNAEPSIEDIQQELLNRFRALNVVQTTTEASSEEEGPSSSAGPKQQRKPGKGNPKKKKKPKKTKGKEPAMEEGYKAFSMEDLRNIDGQDKLASDYLLAVYSAAQQWIELRSFIQHIWHEVAYEKHNTAVAAATSKVAISMVHRTNAAIFVDFPGNDCYLTIVKALARGDVDKAEGTFVVSTTDIAGNTGTRTVVDIKEQFLYHTYEALKEFIQSYRNARTGKPSDKMRKRLNNWDANVDLKTLSEEDRLEWRRKYIIKWLYDLVNVYSAAKVTHNNSLNFKKEKEHIDWYGGNIRTIFGLNEFAADITHMAMQKVNSELDTLIHPHHVFQLQCIVDSFTVSRGWSTPIDSEHSFREPADFQATRDIDLFLDRKEIYAHGGYVLSAQFMRKNLEQTCADYKSLESILNAIIETRDDFHNFLGEHVYAKKEGPWKGIEGSRFGQDDADGLHKYSPFLCGAGLEEALSLSYKQMMWLWQEMREPVLLLHMYRFLKQLDYLQPVALWECLEILFKGCVFPAERYQDDTADVGKTLQVLMGMRQTTRSGTTTTHVGTNIHELYDVSRCKNFNRESSLSAYRRAGWNFETAPNLDCSSDKDMGTLKSMGRKENDDAESDPGEVDNNVPIVQIKSLGETEHYYGQPAKMATQTTTSGDPMPSTAGPSTAKHSAPEPEGLPEPDPTTEIEYRDRDMVNFVNADFLDDVCGFSSAVPARPLSGINYPILTYYILKVFADVEARLSEAQNNMYMSYFEGMAAQLGQRQRVEKMSQRGSMFVTALEKPMDPASIEIFRIMAEVLGQEDRRIWEFTYWEDATREEQKKIRAAQAGTK
jgi:hypothetical protein